jgi:hypothetical protein
LTTIELTESEGVIWARMTEHEREVTLAMFGALLRWWDRTNREPLRDTLVDIRKPSEPPPAPPREPTEDELIGEIESGRYGPGPFRALQQGLITRDNVRRRIAGILYPGQEQAEVPPTNEPLPTAG